MSGILSARFAFSQPNCLGSLSLHYVLTTLSTLAFVLKETDLLQSQEKLHQDNTEEKSFRKQTFMDKS